MTLLVEGYCATPWFREASRRGSLAIDDCAKCKTRLSPLQRQALGCGYEPRLDDKKRLTIWQPPTSKNGYSGPRLTTCAGYTCNLPQVVEAAVARVHWSKGNLPYDRTPEDLLNAVLIVEAQFVQLQSWLVTPASEGGGGS